MCVALIVKDKVIASWGRSNLQTEEAVRGLDVALRHACNPPYVPMAVLA